MSESTALAAPLDMATMEMVLVGGDLSALSPAQRLSYYRAACESIGVNPLTRPFGYIMFDDKSSGEKRLELYAKKDAAEQLGNKHKVSTAIVEEGERDGVYRVKVRAYDNTGRQVEATGVVSLLSRDGKPYTGNFLANLYMKCETKATRRAVLRFCGLGWLDESEIDTVPNARVVVVNDAGEIIDGKAAPRPGNGDGVPADQPHWSTDPVKLEAFERQYHNWGVTTTDALCYLGVPELAACELDPRAALADIWKAHRAQEAEPVDELAEVA